MAGPSATTPRLALPYPIPDDTVDVPRDLQALATKLDGITGISPPVVTALPASPTIGQEVIYQGPPPASLQWRCRWTGSTWLVFGGPPIWIGGSNSGVTGGAGVNVALPGMTITIPAAGRYTIRAQGNRQLTSATATVAWTNFSGGPNPDADATRGFFHVQNATLPFVVETALALAASAVIGLVHSALVGGTFNYYQSVLSAMPSEFTG